ncbi:MAG TPA: single-stranded DNA-binding protein [Acidobacteriota bacterium]|nr:single-stranded DNA-binding protein [Acidobacteriota bacterium]
MGTVNKVLLVGRLGHDPQERTTSEGTRVSVFSLATDAFHGANSEKTTEWHRVVAFGKSADLCNHHLKKGSLVCIEGSIQTRRLEKSTGEKQYFTDIIAARVTFLGTKQSDSPAAAPSAGTNETPF